MSRPSQPPRQFRTQIVVVRQIGSDVTVYSANMFAWAGCLQSEPKFARVDTHDLHPFRLESSHTLTNARVPTDGSNLDIRAEAHPLKGQRLLTLFAARHFAPVSVGRPAHNVATYAMMSS
jgi:hypothetical protein